MAIYRTGVKGFDDAVFAAEQVRQAALVGVTDQGIANVINNNYLQTVIAAGDFYNVLTINEDLGALALSKAGVPPSTGPIAPVGGPFVLDVSVLDGFAVLG